MRAMGKRGMVAVAAGVLACSLGLGSASADNVDVPGPVNAVPTAGTAGIDDGAVLAINEVGGRVYVGGKFTNVGGVSRPNIIALDRARGYAVDTAFRPVVNGEVRAILPGPTGGTVYIGGKFTSVNGQAVKGLALLDAATGARITTFKASAMNGVVNSLKMSPDGTQLLVGGTFTKVAGQARGGFASMNPTTGVLTSYVTNMVTEHHNYNGSGAIAAVGVTDMTFTPDGTKLVAIGNFKKVDGLARDQVVMLDLSYGHGVVADYAIQGYSARCASGAFDSYVRDIDMSADGQFFVIASTGGPYANTLCDTETRFETSSSGTNVQPTWVARTGGDTLFSTAVAGDVVYIGGHQRWLNNDYGSDSAGSGAVPRPGLGALDARTGVPIAWNPGRNPRGVGAQALFVGSDGLWVGSDTIFIGNRLYKRPRVAHFALGTTPLVAQEGTAQLPAGVYVASSSRTGTTYAAYTFTGSSLSGGATGAGALDPSTVRGSIAIGDRLFYATSSGKFAWRSIAADGSLGNENLIDPYNDPYWSGVSTGSGQTYRGKLPSFYGSEAASVTSMFFEQGRLYYTLSRSNGLYYREFSPDSGIMHPTRKQVSGVSMPSGITGTYLTGGVLYAVVNGAMQSAPFSNGAFGGAFAPVPGVQGTDLSGQLLYLH